MKAPQHTGKFKWAGGPHGKPVAGVLLNKTATSAIATTDANAVSLVQLALVLSRPESRSSGDPVRTCESNVRGDNHLLLEIVGIRVDHREKR